MQFHQHEHDPSVLVISADGSLNTELGSDFASEIDEMMKNKVRKVVLDCSNLRYLTSYGLGMMVMLYSKLTKAGGQMKLAGVKKTILRVMEMTHVDQIFELHPDVEAARAAFDAAGATDPPPPPA